VNGPSAGELATVAQDAVTRVMGSGIIIGLLVIWVLVAIFVSCFLLSGAIGIVNEVCSNKKAEFQDILDYGKKYWFSYFKLSFIIGGAVIFVLFAGAGGFIGLSMLGLSKSIIDGLTLVFALFIILFSVLFVPATALLVVKDVRPLEAFKLSFRLARKNYLSLIGLLVTLILVNVLTSFIPYVGQVVGFLFINPIQLIAIVLFIHDRLGEKEKAKSKKKK
jgi:hypothetical protein